MSHVVHVASLVGCAGKSRSRVQVIEACEFVFFTWVCLTSHVASVVASVTAHPKDAVWFSFMDLLSQAWFPISSGGPVDPKPHHTAPKQSTCAEIVRCAAAGKAFVSKVEGPPV